MYIHVLKTVPGATFLWIDMHIFRKFHLNPSFFSPNSLLNKFMIRACCIYWSLDRKRSSNIAFTYFEACS